jgi:hypothetical protein
MKTDEILTLKALQLKSTISGSGNSDLVDHFVAESPEEVKKSLRNICAFISPQLFERVENVCSNLQMSKRQVVEMALIDFMEKVDSIMEKVDPFEGVVIDDSNRSEGE